MDDLKFVGDYYEASHRVWCELFVNSDGVPHARTKSQHIAFKPWVCDKDRHQSLYDRCLSLVMGDVEIMLCLG